MVPAEKLLKEMFGFKGTTPGSMPGLAAGALVMSATRSLFGKAPKSNNSLGNGSGKGSEGNMQAPNKIESAKPWGNNELLSFVSAPLFPLVGGTALFSIVACSLLSVSVC